MTLRVNLARVLRIVSDQLERRPQKPEVVKLLRRVDEEQETISARIATEPWPKRWPRSIGIHVPLVIAPSTIPRAGRGVFSSSAVAQGCVVEVSPAIVLKKDDVAHSSAGMNYFFQAPDGSELLCVLGFGMMFNHSSGSGANLRYAVRVTPDDVEPPGICVSFEATRDIVAGEELFIDYSSAWWARHKGSPSSADAVGALAEGFANK